MDGHVKMAGQKARRQRQTGQLVWNIHVKNRSTGIAMAMAMLMHVRAVTGRPAIDRHLPRHPALHQGIQAIINRGHGNFRHRVLGPDKDFLRRGMVALVAQHIIHLLTLRRQAKTGGPQLFSQVLLISMRAAGLQGEDNVTQPTGESRFRIILNVRQKLCLANHLKVAAGGAAGQASAKITVLMWERSLPLPPSVERPERRLTASLACPFPPCGRSGASVGDGVEL